MNFGSSNSDTTTAGSSNELNQYDPDRDYLQRLLAYEGYGPEGVTGSSYDFQNPNSSNIYSDYEPHWDWARQPQGPQPGRGPQGGVGTGGGNPNDFADSGYGGPGGASGGRNTRVVTRGGNTSGAGGGTRAGAISNYGPGSTPTGGSGVSVDLPSSSEGLNRVGGTNRPAPSLYGDAGGGRGPGGSSNPNPGGPGGPGGGGGGGGIGGGLTGNPYPNDETFINGPGHGSGPGVVGPQVRPANPGGPSVYAGPFDKWGQGGASGNRQMAGGDLWNAYSDMAAHPDLDPSVKDAITVGANNAANAQYDSAKGALDRYGKTTGNAAGSAAATAQLAMDRAGTASDVNRQNLIDFEQLRRQRQAQGLQGVSGLYQGEGAYNAGLLGARAQLAGQPIGRNSTTQGSGNFVGTNFGLSVM